MLYFYYAIIYVKLFHPWAEIFEFKVSVKADRDARTIRDARHNGLKPKFPSCRKEVILWEYFYFKDHS